APGSGCAPPSRRRRPPPADRPGKPVPSPAQSGVFSAMKRNAVAWAALVVSTAALIGSQNWYRSAPAQPQLPQEGLAEAKKLSAAFEAVAEFVSPSVVQISVQRAPEIRRRGGGEGGPPGPGPQE